MANRFPLVIDSSAQQVKELPSGDNLDLTGSGILNNTATITLPTATGTLATLAGTETLTNKTYSSGALAGTFTGDASLSGYINFSGTASVKLPVGTTAQRGTAATGQVRYNSSLASFEGYNGTAWSSLGGVKSVDGLTFIQAETSSGASNGELEFYAEDSAGTGTQKLGGWNRTRLEVINQVVAPQGVQSPVALMSNNITTSFSIPEGYNAISAGPIAVANGISVTVPSGSVWTIV